MFRKKPDIPPRPKLPNIEQIIDDIEHSSPSDVAFRIKSNSELSAQDSRINLNGPDAAYLKVKNFLEINTVLKETLQRLQDQSEALKISDLELKAIADDIRKQALEVLQ